MTINEYPTLAQRTLNPSLGKKDVLINESCDFAVKRERI